MSKQKALGIVHDCRRGRGDQRSAEGHSQGRKEREQGLEEIQLAQITALVVTTEHHEPCQRLLVPELGALRRRSRSRGTIIVGHSVGEKLLESMRSQLDEGITINHRRLLSTRTMSCTPGSTSASTTSCSTATLSRTLGIALMAGSTAVSTTFRLGFGTGCTALCTACSAALSAALGVGLSARSSGVTRYRVGLQKWLGEDGWKRRTSTTLTTLVPEENFTAGTKIQSAGVSTSRGSPI